MSDQIQEKAEVSKSLDMNKLRLIKAGILSGIIIALFGFLFLFIFLGRSSWENGLRDQVSKVLTEKSFVTSDGTSFAVGDIDFIQSGLSSNFVSYSLVDGNGNLSNLHGVLVRMNTIYGPIASIFVYDSVSGTTSFIDFANLDGVAKNSIYSAALCSQIPYWEKRIPKIMENSKIVKQLKGE